MGLNRDEVGPLPVFALDPKTSKSTLMPNLLQEMCFSPPFQPGETSELSKEDVFYSRWCDNWVLTGSPWCLHSMGRFRHRGASPLSSSKKIPVVVVVADDFTETGRLMRRWSWWICEDWWWGSRRGAQNGSMNEVKAERESCIKQQPDDWLTV